MSQFGHTKRSNILHAARPDGYAACNMMLKLTDLHSYNEREGWLVCQNRACLLAQDRARAKRRVEGAE